MCLATGIAIAHVRDKWEVSFVPVSWTEGLTKLQSGEIDLITSAAHSPEYDQTMDYNRSPIIEVWGQVFIPEDMTVEHISDLNGKRVGVMQEDYWLIGKRSWAENVPVWVWALAGLSGLLLLAVNRIMHSKINEQNHSLRESEARLSMAIKAEDALRESKKTTTSSSVWRQTESWSALMTASSLRRTIV